jgi:hypothetical protein
VVVRTAKIFEDEGLLIRITLVERGEAAHERWSAELRRDVSIKMRFTSELAARV